MVVFYISLKSTSEICAFVNAATKSSAEIDVVSGRYTVDAKSIMGLFSLNLDAPLRVCVYGDDEIAESFRKSVATYQIEAPVIDNSDTL